MFIYLFLVYKNVLKKERKKKKQYKKILKRKYSQLEAEYKNLNCAYLV